MNSGRIKKQEQFMAKDIEYETPDYIFCPLDKEFHFTLDVCATPKNTKCVRFFSKEDDGLSQNWSGVCWMNPPFGKVMKKWVEKAHLSSINGATVVMLIPVRSNTNWWHKHIMESQSEIRFIRGEVVFKGQKNGLWQPMCIIVMRPQKIRKANPSPNSPMLFATHIPEADTSA